ncbi:MAG TPA: amidohydrolase [Bacillota bacterium]|nr:amidohydrolase [Bacillota bacterium]
MKSADIVLKGNAIFTARCPNLISGGIAIKGNKIVAVGDVGAIDRWIGEETRVFTYDDKLIMPGFIDAHDHYFMGAISASEHMCTEIAASTSEEECVAIINRFAEGHPLEKRILGIGWFPANWGDAPLPTKRSLDAVISDRPVYLLSADVHTFWMNSKALDEAGITPEMKPRSGEVGRFDNGELNGLIFEPEAFAPAMAKVMDLDKEVMKDVHRKFLNHIAACGVTSISEMSADDYTETTYKNYGVVKEMEEEGELISRIHLYTRLAGYTDFSKAKELEKLYCSEKLRISGVKGFVDGVTSTFTGYLLEPYSDRPETSGIGAPLETKEDMESYIVAANREGLAVRLHCIGDGAVRMALDMFEASEKENGKHGLKNTIEHIESIHPDDIPRFAELDVIPSMQPYHLTLDCNEKIARIGMERCRWEWPHKTILERGGKLAFGTDYPVVDFNPFPSIYAAVTRCDDNGKPTGINPEERISLTDALTAYTAGSANAYGRLKDLGTLEEGKLADVIVVDRNLFTIGPLEIKDASVELTVMDGRIVYKKKVGIR